MSISRIKFFKIIVDEYDQRKKVYVIELCLYEHDSTDVVTICMLFQ